MGTVYATAPPVHARTQHPPWYPGQKTYTMYKTYYIAGVQIIALSLSEAYAYYRNNCMW